MLRSAFFRAKVPEYEPRSSEGAAKPPRIQSILPPKRYRDPSVPSLRQNKEWEIRKRAGQLCSIQDRDLR